MSETKIFRYKRKNEKNLILASRAAINQLKMRKIKEKLLESKIGEGSQGRSKDSIFIIC